MKYLEVDNLTIHPLTSAFKKPSFPCNPIPFAYGLIDGVRTKGTDWIQTDEAKAMLYVLIAQSYGQLFSIESFQEFSRLNEIF